MNATASFQRAGTGPTLDSGHTRTISKGWSMVVNTPNRYNIAPMCPVVTRFHDKSNNVAVIAEDFWPLGDRLARGQDHDRACEGRSLLELGQGMAIGEGYHVRKLSETSHQPTPTGTNSPTRKSILELVLFVSRCLVSHPALHS